MYRHFDLLLLFCLLLLLIYADVFLSKKKIMLVYRTFLLSQTTMWSCIRVLKKKEQAIDSELLVVICTTRDLLVKAS